MKLHGATEHGDRVEVDLPELSKPTFDEWHLTKFGESFEAAHQQPHHYYAQTFRALSRLLRDYVTEMTR